MQGSRKRSALRRCSVIAGATVMGICASATMAATAAFEVRLAASESDTVLDLSNPLDQVLDLELWVTLEDSPSAALLAYSFFLTPTAEGVITVLGDSVVNRLAPDPLLPQGPDNEPLSGAFSRAFFALLPGEVLTAGSTQLASFSVTANQAGTVSYVFSSALPTRPWQLDFVDLSSATPTAGAPLTIQVVPEPAVGSMWLGGMVLVAGRRRRPAG